MRQRCNNPKNHAYKNYGGRGIYVTDEWDQSFEKFVSDMGPRPSSSHQIDRINNDGPYASWNCRWATREENLRNKRTNSFVFVSGQKMTIAEAAIAIGLSQAGVVYRKKHGLPMTKGKLQRF
jgi:hypothetical protein